MEEQARDKLTNSLLNRVFLDAVAVNVNRDFNRRDKVILVNRAEQQVIFKKAITKAIPCVRAYLFLNKQQKEKLLEKLSKVIVKLINSIELAIVYPYRKFAKLFAIKGLYNDKNFLIKKGLHITGTMTLRGGVFFDPRIAYLVKMAVPDLDKLVILIKDNLEQLIEEESRYRNAILISKYFTDCGSGAVVRKRVQSYLVSKDFLLNYNNKNTRCFFNDLVEYRINTNAKEKNKKEDDGIELTCYKKLILS